VEAGGRGDVRMTENFGGYGRLRTVVNVAKLIRKQQAKGSNPLTGS
jgi:hypothetical protein